LHGCGIHVLHHADAPVDELVAAAAISGDGDRLERADFTERGTEVRVLPVALPLAVLAVENGVADAEEVPRDAAREVEEARVVARRVAALDGETVGPEEVEVDIDAGRDGILILHVTPACGAREEQA